MLNVELPGQDRTDHATERQQLGAAIAACVAALPEPQRVVLVLRDYHELDYDDIARMLELELGTVKSRLARARGALREALTARIPDAVRELGGRHA